VPGGFTEQDLPDQSGRVILVTGANTGIGFEIARALALRGARVLLGCRSAEKAEAAAGRIRASAPGADLAPVVMDLGDLSSLRAAASGVSETEPKLDTLINNAGLMRPPYGRTKDGFELQFGVNHLGPFALTGLLSPKLMQTPGARVVTTSSIAHKKGRIDFEDLHAERSYEPMGRYRMSKLANLLFAFELQRRLAAAGSATRSLACHPGVADSDLWRYAPRAARMASPFLRIVMNSAAAGAWPALLAATDPQIEGGAYVGPQKRGETAGPAGPANVAPQARDPVTARRLWEVSAELTGVDPGL